MRTPDPCAPRSVTFNALMIVKRIRDPREALDPGRLFAGAGAFTDDDLRSAFLLYNSQRPKVTVTAGEPAPQPRGVRGLVRRWFGGTP